MTNAKYRVDSRLMRGDCTVNARKKDGHTLYEDLSDLVRDYESLLRAVQHLTQLVINEPTHILTEAERRDLLAQAR